MFNLAVMLGDAPNHLDLLNTLSIKEPADIIRYQLRINRAAQCGHVNALHFCIRIIASKASYKTITPAFQLAASQGHIAVMEYFEKIAPQNLQDLIAANDFEAFINAAAHGQLDILHNLESKSPHNLQKMIDTEKYKAFRQAAGNNQLDILKYLENKALPQLQDMIIACDYDAFQGALENGHLDVLKYLEEKAPNRLQEIIAIHYQAIFPPAVTNGHQSMVHYLLNHPSVFAYAEMHQHKYGGHVASFVAQKLISLAARQQQAVENNLDVVFDITSLAEQKLLFYIVRNLIRRNDANLIDDLRFLLNIPSIKAMAHTAVTTHQSNELLRLALTVGNQAAATVLLNLPQVRALSAQNDYYRREQQGRLDLADLAADRESSMTALTQSEQQQLQAVIDLYQPLLDKAGIDNIMSDLRQTLMGHNNHPATITIQIDDNHQDLITLPIEWNDFEALNLNSEQKDQAFKAYYPNKPHTAWRYLSKPNLWMNENASYVYINEEDHNERWSTFEEYQSLISLFYLAAIDKNTSCIDEYTFATRLEHFIDELAHIGRAHNWDKTRLKENGEYEQYDDLEGDRPAVILALSAVSFNRFSGILY